MAAPAAREVGVTAYAMAQDLLRSLLRVAMPPAPPQGPPEAVAGLVQRVTGVDLTQCPECGVGRLRRSTGLTAGLVAIFRAGTRLILTLDT